MASPLSRTVKATVPQVAGTKKRRAAERLAASRYLLGCKGDIVLLIIGAMEEAKKGYSSAVWVTCGDMECILEILAQDALSYLQKGSSAVAAKLAGCFGMCPKLPCRWWWGSHMEGPVLHTYEV